jgi:hypothetical protein
LVGELFRLITAWRTALRYIADDVR